jgi:hypothetical protein
MIKLNAPPCSQPIKGENSLRLGIIFQIRILWKNPEGEKYLISAMIILL